MIGFACRLSPFEGATDHGTGLLLPFSLSCARHVRQQWPGAVSSPPGNDRIVETCPEPTIKSAGSVSVDLLIDSCWTSLCRRCDSSCEAWQFIRKPVL